MASMRSNSSRCLCHDDCVPSTSGRGNVVYTKQRSRGRIIGRANMPQMYNTNPIPLNVSPGSVIKGVRTPATPRLTPERVMQRLAETTDDAALKQFGAFYSSELGGIVTEPGFMVVHINDHMAHRGDAVFENVPLVEGYLYQFEEHFERFKASAELAGLPLPMSEQRVCRALLDTAAASMKINGMLTFWLSRGRGSFGIIESTGPAVYAMLNTESVYKAVDRDNGWRALTSPVEPKPQYFTAMKNVSRMQESVAHLEAMSRGGDVAVLVDDEGIVLYGSCCSLAILTADNVLVIPPDESGLAGMAARNLAELTAQYSEDENLTVDRVERRTFTVDELKAAKEAFAVSTREGVVGISHIDDQFIGQHAFVDQAGPVSLALNEMLMVDRQPKEGSTRHTEVPYGYMTGMRDQLR